MIKGRAAQVDSFQLQSLTCLMIFSDGIRLYPISHQSENVSDTQCN